MAIEPLPRKFHVPLKSSNSKRVLENTQCVQLCCMCVCSWEYGGDAETQVSTEAGWEEGQSSVTESMRCELYSLQYYTVAVGKLNVAKMANFMEIDVFVLVACPENSLVESQVTLTLCTREL